MKHISDDTLSAFFDNELPAEKMEAVRDALAEDPELTDRLAQLVLVNEQVKQHAVSIDKHPVPVQTLNLLSSAKQQTHSGWWHKATQRATQISTQRLAMAASVFLVVGMFGGYWLSPANSPSTSWQLVEEQLFSAPSGQSVALTNGQSFTSQFSFNSTAGHLCRVYQLDNTQRAESIACWQADSGWQNILTVYSASVGDDEYALASGSVVMQQQVAALQASPLLSVEQERAALQQLRAD